MEKEYKGVIFDMDGLLFDTETIYCEASLNLAPKYGLTGYDKAVYMRYVGISDEELQQAYYRDFSDVPKKMIDGFMDETHQEVKKMFLAGRAALKPGVVEILRYFKQENIPCVVASSNLRMFIDILLENAKIRSFFVGIISAEDVVRAKPDPEIVEKAVEMLGITASECLMLEDSYNGVRASYEAGVDVIMVPDLLQPIPEISEKTLMVKSDLSEVKQLFIK